MSADQGVAAQHQTTHMMLDIISLEGSLFQGEVRFVAAPGRQGELGILPRHAPLLTELIPGDVHCDLPSGERLHFYVNGGILEVQPHHVSILSDLAVRAADLDEAAALEAKRLAEEKLAARRTDLDYGLIESELAEAVARLRTLERMRRAGHRG